MNRTGSRLFFTLILIFQTLTLSAQEIKGPLKEPLPYQDVEFPEWAHDLRRFEVIMFGSFPITYILSSLVFDLSSLATGDDSNSGFSLATEKNQDELKLLLITSASLSGAIAIADLIIGKVKKKNARNRIPEDTGYRKEEAVEPGNN